MRLLSGVAALLLAISQVGCADWTWQANRSSQAVDFDLLRDPALSSANGPGYMDGMAQDMRSKH
jgi:hypothetical protein